MRRLTNLNKIQAIAVEDESSVAATTTPATPPEAPATPATEAIVGQIAGSAVAGQPIDEVKDPIKNEEKNAAGQPTDAIVTVGSTTVAIEGADKPKFDEETVNKMGCAIAEALKSVFIVKGDHIPPGKITPTATGLSGGPTKTPAMSSAPMDKPVVKLVPKPATAKANPAMEGDTAGGTPSVTEPSMANATEGMDNVKPTFSEEDITSAAMAAVEAMVSVLTGKATPTKTGMSGGSNKEPTMSSEEPKAAETVVVPKPATAKANPAMEADTTLPADVLPPELEAAPVPAAVATPPDGTPPVEVAPAATAVPAPEVTTTGEATVADATTAAPVDAVATPPEGTPVDTIPSVETPAAAPAANEMPPTDPAASPAQEPAAAAPVTPDGAVIPPEGNTGADGMDGGPGATTTPEGGTPPAGSDVAPEFPADPPPVALVPAEGQTQADPVAADVTPDAGEAIIEIEDSDLTSNEDGLNDDIIALSQPDEFQPDTDENMLIEAEGVMEALESMYVALESTLVSGGIHQITGNILAASLNQMYNQVGIKKGSPIVALESMVEGSQSIATTELAMEDIGKSITKIKNSIVRALKNVIDVLVRFFRRVFLSYKKIGERAKKLSDKISTVTGTPREMKFSHKRLSRALCIDNVIPTNFVAATKEYTTLTETVLSDISDYGVGPMIKKFKTILAQPTKEEMFGQLEFKINHKIFSTTVDSAKVDHDTVPDNFTLLGTKVFFGNKVLVGVMPKETITGDELYRNLESIDMEISKYSVIGKPNSEMVVLSLADAKEVISSVMHICERVIGFEKDFDRICATMYQCVDDVEKYLSKGERIGAQVGVLAGGVAGGLAGSHVGMAVDSAIAGAAAGGYIGSKIGNKVAKMSGETPTSAFIKEMRHLSWQVLRLGVDPAHSFFVDSMGTSNALLDYAESSMKMYA